MAENKGKTKDKSQESRRSWFCVLNNPEKIFGELEPKEIVDKAIDMFVDGKPTRSCGVNYEKGELGTPHLHMVLEDSNKIRFASLQKMFPGIHIEPTRGTKEQALDYINKVGRFEEKQHTVIVPAVIYGKINANQGQRKDLDYIQDLIEAGEKPEQIFNRNLSYRRYENIVLSAYNAKIRRELALVRDVNLYWHLGDSGSGKSYSYVGLVEKYGLDNVYKLDDCQNGGFDKYQGQNVLFIDEYKGEFSYKFMLQLFDKYPLELHCRYSNVWACWNEVHITSVYGPEEIYNRTVDLNSQNVDSFMQLKRRIKEVIYHYVDSGEYKEMHIPGMAYTKRSHIKQRIDEMIVDIPTDEEWRQLSISES